MVPPLTVVLVHGAFADASSWNRRRRTSCRQRGCRSERRRIHCAASRTTPPTSPSFIEQIPGPVLAVGHSYGGAVISNAATDAANVVGLVFVAAFAPEEGERLGEVESTSKDSVLNTALVPLRYPTGHGRGRSG